jgi:hypothetical protein
MGRDTLKFLTLENIYDTLMLQQMKGVILNG